MQNHQNKRHEDCPDRIDVRQRVQSQPSPRLSGGIAEPVSDVAVRDLVEDNGGEHGNKRKDYLQDMCDVHGSFFPSLGFTVSVSSWVSITRPRGAPFGLRTYLTGV